MLAKFLKSSIIISHMSVGVARVYLDARKPEVIVPEQFKHLHNLVLDLSFNFAEDFPVTTNEDGIHAVLSFNRTPATVFLPWDAIWAAHRLGETPPRAFPESVPPEAWKEDSVVDLEALDGMGETSPPRTGHLKLVN